MSTITEFPLSSGLNEPCRNHTFLVKWDGRTIPGISRVLGLTRITEVVENRDGDNPVYRKSAGSTRFEVITLERGLSDDTSFEDWANLIWKPDVGPGSDALVREFRKDVVIELYNDAEQLVRAYIVRRSWPSEYQALSTLDAGEAAVVTERIRLENEGWERDPSVNGQAEP